MAHFTSPVLFDNTSGWGPTQESINTKFQEIPYTPFNKADKLGKVADNFGLQAPKGRDYTSQAFGSGHTVFNFTTGDDTSAFQVASHKEKKKKSSRTRWQPRPSDRLKKRRDQNLATSYSKHDKRGKLSATSQSKWQKQAGRNANARYGAYNKFNRDKLTREASVEVKSDWRVVDQLDFADLRKIKGETLPEPEDIVTAGNLEFYDPSYDSIEIKRGKPLTRSDRVFPQTTATDDPIIQGLCLKAEAEEGHIFFTTDSILAHLMTCPRSAYSWDIIVRRIGKVIFIDKREDSQIDLPTVNETSQTPPKKEDESDGTNSPEKLSLEAAYINRLFSLQVLQKGKSHSLGAANPFQGTATNEEIAPVGYRYRKWDLGDGNTLVCRCELNGVVEEGGKIKYLSIRALNEYDPKAAGVDWRQSLTTQRGTVLATELKNNSHKLSKWTAQALLAGADYLKIGYVSRVTVRNNTSHVVLGVQTYKTAEFAREIIGLGVANMWGIVRHFINSCLKLDYGNYVLLKDPIKAIARLYAVPEDAFEDDGAIGDIDEEDDMD
eukprot:TRINITY_DN1773_c0_g1_i1.p1 TRINITY_DN1773_c0_g1~~TRINITY_DN1773_c0_g1_i1.p1  ORF type:complete len:565 (+),score=159.25 TRINITY_DN1773_c0_g1_i1:48-1697(+)